MSFAFNRYWLSKKIAQPIIVLVVLLVMLACKSRFEGHFDWWEPAIGLTAIMIPALIWYNDARKNMEQLLPKRLDIFFVFRDYALGPDTFNGGNDRLVLYCRGAYLAGESDIRNWAQQIGRQMNNNADLKFTPYFMETSQGPRKINSKWVKPYFFKIILTEAPNFGVGKSDSDKQIKDAQALKGQSDKGLCLIWDDDGQGNILKCWGKVISVNWEDLTQTPQWETDLPSNSQT